MLIFFLGGGVTFPFTFPKSSCDFGVCHIFRHTHDTSDVIKTVWKKTSRNLRHCQNFMVITHCLGKHVGKNMVIIQIQLLYNHGDGGDGVDGGGEGLPHPDLHFESSKWHLIRSP